MKNWYEILISITAALSVMSLFYALRKAAFGFSLIVRDKGRKKDYRKNTLVKFFTKLYSTKKRMLSVLIFTVLVSVFYMLFKNFILSLMVSLCLGIYLMDFLSGLEEKKKHLLNIQLVEFISDMTVLLKAGKTILFRLKA